MFSKVLRKSEYRRDIKVPVEEIEGHFSGMAAAIQVIYRHKQHMAMLRRSWIVILPYRLR